MSFFLKLAQSLLRRIKIRYWPDLGSIKANEFETF